jgi:nucleotide-binding universal stress UspA family protein
VSLLFKKKKWDKQPTDPVGVLLASDGQRKFGTRAVARAAALAGADPVGVLTIAKVYGSSFGLPVPGLLPTKEEVQERLAWIRDSVGRLEEKGIEADGQVAQTRHAVRTIAKIARVRQVDVVVIESREQPKWRRVIEGDVASGVARSLRGSGIEVEVVPGLPASQMARSQPARARSTKR